MKRESELRTRLDQWLYFIKNLQNFADMPTIFKDEVFEQAFEKAELSNMAPAERDKYEQSLKVYRDLKNVIDTAYDEGLLEGERKVAKQLKDLGVAIEIIMQATGLTAEEIAKL